MIIRLAQMDDAAALARVIVDSGRAAHQGQMPDELLLRVPLEEAYAESQRNWLRTLHAIADDADAQECIYVAQDASGEVVGLAMGGPPRTETLEQTGEVYVLYILASHQRRGLGRRLVQAVSDHLAQSGTTALEIGCLAANAPARRFYESIGGHVVRERLFDQDGVMLPEVVYRVTRH